MIRLLLGITNRIPLTSSRPIGFIVSLILLLSCPSVLAEESSGDSPKFSLGLGLGVEAFDDQTYQKLSLSPELAIGKFGIGLDLSLRYTIENGNLVIRSQDWVPDEVNWVDVLSLYLAKFQYIRYGIKGEPLYIKFGSVVDGTLGNGFIMNGYANTLFLPERRIFGLSLDLDGALFQFPLIGLETHMGDLSAFDVMGARLYVRPLFMTEIPVLKALQLGFTFAADRNPYRYADSGVIDNAESEGIRAASANVWALGGDIRLPVFDGSSFSLTVFGDIVTLKAKSLGGMTGISGRLFTIILYGAQIRIIGESFVPSYFDSTYDISRAQRYSLIEGDQSTPGFIGWYSTLGLSLANDALILVFSLEGPFGTVDENRDNYLNYPRFRGALKVKEGLLPGFSFDLVYDKSMIRNFVDMGDPEGAVAQAHINYRAGPAVISFFYKLRYGENGWDNPEVSSGLGTTIQLF
ncbi:MAG TPA: hypothetical protein VMX75_02660 [Spirochaetia bacterium]|nr:hypothetical protein [Spirochaetia bacterium]